MRICDLTTLYLDGAQGGVNTYLTEKARYLAGRPDVEQHLIIVPGRTTERRQLFDSTVQTIKSPSLPGNPQHRVLTGLGEVKRLLRDERPSLVEVDCAYFLGEVASWCGDIPIVGLYHVHLPRFISDTWLPPAIGRLTGGLAGMVTERLAWRYVDFCQRRCDRLVVTSEDIRQRLEQAGYEGLELIPLGVNLDLFTLAPERAAGEASGPPTVLYVGRLSPEKQVDVLIDAFGVLAARRPELRLRVVGDGPCLQALRRRAHGLGEDIRDRIAFVGAVPYGPELARQYAAADVFASPGANETFNLTVLEALASGLPVVAADRGGPRSLIEEPVGLLAEPDSAPALAAALARLLDRRPSRAACRAHVESRYSWRRTFDQLWQVYGDALASSVGGVGDTLGARGFTPSLDPDDTTCAASGIAGAPQEM